MGDLVETRQNELKRKKICRFCLSQDEAELTSIYARDNKSKTTPLPLQVMACVAIEIFSNDSMPLFICRECRVTFDYCYRFKQMCKQADNALRHYPLTGIWNEPMDRPKVPYELIKGIKTTQKEKPMPVNSLQIQRIKTDCDMENGEILLLTEAEMARSQDEQDQMQLEAAIEQDLEREREQERESEQEQSPEKPKPPKPPKPAQKQMKAAEKPSQKLLNKSAIRILNKEANCLIEPRMTKPVIKRDNDGNIAIVTEILDLNDNMPAPDPIESAAIIETNVFPCPHCERSFPLRQLLEIHMVNHNRERRFDCSSCDKSFFSKYDLQKHVLVHTGEKPYRCVVCNKGFTRSTLLHRHEKIHTDIPKFICVYCEKPFISQLEMEKHTERHRKLRPFVCKICNKAFAFKQGLERHENVHCRFQPYQCQYCDLSFSTPSKLSRHLTAHAGKRPYPCKLCPKSYLLSHHLTRHLRSHKFGTGSYKCSDCEKIFNNRDDLIYHSAVHATQTLICPLCKDVFQDIKTVTDHVKMHAEGEAYACEFCDMIFMTAVRLQDHTNLEHADEMMAYNEDANAEKASNERQNSEETNDETNKAEAHKSNNESRDFEEVIEEFLVDELSDAGGESANGAIVIKEEVNWQTQGSAEQRSNEQEEEEEIDYMNLIEMNESVEEPPLKISKTSSATQQVMKRATAAPTPSLARKPPTKPTPQQSSSSPPSPKDNKKPLMKTRPLAQIKIEPTVIETPAAKTRQPMIQAALKGLPRSVSVKKVLTTPQNAEPKQTLTKPNVRTPPKAPEPTTTSPSNNRSLRQRTDTSPNVKSPTKPSPSTSAELKKPATKPGEAGMIKKLTPIVGDKKIVEMMIGDKKVKVQKITMSKAQAAAMAREGRIHMKEGTMILKKSAPRKPN